MRKHCFVLHVRPDRLDEYRRRHAAVWPEMLQALKESGWHNYSLFVRADGLLVGYVESADLDEARLAMTKTSVNARWQGEMAEFFDAIDTAPDEAFVELDQIFNLEGQLARLQPATEQRGDQ